MDIKDFRYDGDRRYERDKFDTKQSGGFAGREEAASYQEELLQRMSLLQDRLFAQNQEGLLIILQAMDAAGKDGVIKYVMSGINPAGIDVHSFKNPSAEELDHDYMWRAMKAAPERGRMAIFNRSYYEEVLVVKVHDLHLISNLPDRCKTDDIFAQRYEQIKNYEKYLYQNGFRTIKIFLHISKEEQQKQLLQRIDDEAKNWKFSDTDLVERDFWDQYQQAYEDMVNATSTHHCPWYVVPSDHKWFSRLVVAQAVVDTLEDIAPEYPQVSAERREKLLQLRRKLAQD